VLETFWTYCLGVDGSAGIETAIHPPARREADSRHLLRAEALIQRRESWYGHGPPYWGNRYVRGRQDRPHVQRGQVVTAYSSNVERSSVLRVSNRAPSLTRSAALESRLTTSKLGCLCW
jgi:hypothetical protein